MADPGSHGTEGPAAVARLPIVQYWHTADIPTEVNELMDTFRDRNPGRTHLVFDESTAEEFISEHFGEREVQAFRACAVPSMQSDFLRYCAVYAMGGVYCDADAHCTAPLDTMLDLAAAGLLFRRGTEGNVVSWLFAFQEPHHPLMRLAVELITANVEQRFGRDIWWMTGPGILTFLVTVAEIDGPGAGPQAVARARGGLARTLPLSPDQRRAWQERLGRHMLEAGGGRANVVAALDGVRIEPLDRSREWVVHVESDLDYKDEPDYWIKWRGSGRPIFR